MRRRLLVVLGGACVAVVLSHASPAAAATVPNAGTTTTVTDIGVGCTSPAVPSFLATLTLNTALPTAVGSGNPLDLSVVSANFFGPMTLSGTLQFEEHFKITSAAPSGNVTLSSGPIAFSAGGPNPLDGTTLTQQFTAGAAGATVRAIFTGFAYTIAAEDFVFAVDCRPAHPVLVAQTPVTAPDAASAHGRLGSCRTVPAGLRSCTQFDLRSTRTRAGTVRGKIDIECDRASVVKFTSQQVTALDVTDGVATVAATGRLGDGSDATATIVATDGPTYDKLSVKIRAGAHVVCTANGRLDDGTVVLKT